MSSVSLTLMHVQVLLNAVHQPTAILFRRVINNGLTDTIVAQAFAILPKVTLSVEPKHG